MQQPEPQLLNGSAAARMLGYGRTRFYALVKSGVLPKAISIGPSSRRWRVRDLQAVIDGTWQPSNGN